MLSLLDNYPIDDYTDAFYCRECALLRVERYPYRREVDRSYVQLYRLYGTQSLYHGEEMDCPCGGHCTHLRLDGMQNFLRINQMPVYRVSSTSFPQEGEEMTTTYRAEQLTDRGMHGFLVGRWVIREEYTHIAATAIVRKKGVGVPILYKDEGHAQKKLKAVPACRLLKYCEGQWMITA
jgi:hypothetical protein